MKTTTACSVIVLALFACSMHAEEHASALTDAKVGDFVEYTMKAAGKSYQIEMVQKRTVTAKDGIPLGGMVKMEGSGEHGSVTMTLTNFGSGK